MLYLIFITVVFGLARFHLREHRAFVQGLIELVQKIRKDEGGLETLLAMHDWRSVGRSNGETGVYTLRRAFRVQTREEMVRYFLPIIFFCVMLLVLQNWWLAFAYLAIVAVKWFGTATRLDVASGQYAVILGHFKLFGEVLPKAAGDAKLSVPE